MARATVSQRPQFGVESALGSTASCTHVLRATDLTIKPKIDVKEITAGGARFRTGTYVAKDSSEGKIEGVPCYRELAYLLALAFAPDATPTETVADTVWTYTFGIDDAPASWTCQYGQTGAGNAAQVTGVIATGIELSWKRSSGDAKVSVDVLGQLFADGATLTANPVATDTEVVNGTHVSVYLDTAYANLGDTKLTSVLAVDVKLPSIRDGVWFLDSAKTSWADVVSKLVDGSVELNIEANTVGQALLTSLRDADVSYLRIEAVGPAIDVDNDHKLTIDLAVTGKDHDRQDEEAVYAAKHILQVIEDADGFSHSVTLVTDVDPAA